MIKLAMYLNNDRIASIPIRKEDMKNKKLVQVLMDGMKSQSRDYILASPCSPWFCFEGVPSKMNALTVVDIENLLNQTKAA